MPEPRTAEERLQKFVEDHERRLRALEAIDLPDCLSPAEHTLIGDAAPHHPPVTLDVTAEVLLDLTVQELSLDLQAKNTVLAGPAAGAAAAPTFRALADADIAGLTAPAHDLLSASHGDTVPAVVSTGSLVVGTAGGWDELVIGGNGAIMISNGTMAVWQAGVTRGSLFVGIAGPTWGELAVGGAGTVLTSDGADVAWAALPNTAALVQAAEPAPTWVGQIWLDTDAAAEAPLDPARSWMGL